MFSIAIVNREGLDLNCYACDQMNPNDHTLLQWIYFSDHAGDLGLSHAVFYLDVSSATFVDLDVGGRQQVSWVQKPNIASLCPRWFSFTGDFSSGFSPQQNHQKLQGTLKDMGISLDAADEAHFFQGTLWRIY